MSKIIVRLKGVSLSTTAPPLNTSTSLHYDVEVEAEVHISRSVGDLIIGSNKGRPVSADGLLKLIGAVLLYGKNGMKADVEFDLDEDYTKELDG